MMDRLTFATSDSNASIEYPPFENEAARSLIDQLEELKRRKLLIRSMQDEEERGLLKNLQKLDEESHRLSARSPTYEQIQEQINKKEALCRRLDELAAAERLREGGPVDHLNRTLQEQERRNQDAVARLKKEIQGYLEERRSRAASAEPVLPPPPLSSRGKTFGSISEEVNALRQQYLASGGADSGVLVQMAEAAVDAAELEAERERRRRAREVAAVQRENELLGQLLLQMRAQRGARPAAPMQLGASAARPDPLLDWRLEEEAAAERRREARAREAAVLRAERDLWRHEATLRRLREEVGRAAEAEDGATDDASDSDDPQE